VELGEHLLSHAHLLVFSFRTKKKRTPLLS
jgi:hypothetical protein